MSQFINSFIGERELILISLYQFRGKIEKGEERTFKLNVILSVSHKNDKIFNRNYMVLQFLAERNYGGWL